MSFYARPCEIHALNRICPHGDCVKVVREIDVAQLVASLTEFIEACEDDKRYPLMVERARAALAKLGAK